ncbi:hypothetical protein LCGC14_2998850 [marine sediment metagenome]|uniref:Uncharacterized protein n=1 Tax=marine sediment metagenome TaxID=412755 RepID=A0A0F8XP85_9ZZZZ
MNEEVSQRDLCLDMAEQVRLLAAEVERGLSVFIFPAKRHDLSAALESVAKFLDTHALLHWNDQPLNRVLLEEIRDLLHPISVVAGHEVTLEVEG